MDKYQHKIQYYETDKMGITHHSNYIRWFEEARVDFLERAGFGYDRMESLGVFSPVLSVRAEYKKMTSFPETVDIYTSITKFTGVRFCISYVVKNAVGEICCVGESEHCFIDSEGKPVRPKNAAPEIYEMMCRLLQKGE